jgi:RimJ/RimL family protein N-acetyltransferase
MCNHQEEGMKLSYKNEYLLRDGQKLILRNPKVGDEQGLIDHMKVVDGETKFLAREPGEFSLTLEQERKFIESSMNNKNVFFLVGEIDGKIIANCSVGIVMNKKRFLHRASMGIAVRQDYWHRGIGKRMMEECIEWCREKGIEQLELEAVTQNERAISMYRSLGFQIQGTKKHAMKYGDGSYADEYFMILFIKDINAN